MPTTSFRSKCTDQMPTKLAYSVVFVLGLVAYAGSLHGPFVLDDLPAIVHNRDVHSYDATTGAGAWTNLFKNDYWGTYQRELALSHSQSPNQVLCGRSSLCIFEYPSLTDVSLSVPLCLATHLLACRNTDWLTQEPQVLSSPHCRYIQSNILLFWSLSNSISWSQLPASRDCLCCCALLGVRHLRVALHAAALIY